MTAPEREAYSDAFLETPLGMFADLCNKHGVSLAITSDKNLNAALMEFCAALSVSPAVTVTEERHMSDKAEVVDGCQCAICKLHLKSTTPQTGSQE